MKGENLEFLHARLRALALQRLMRNQRTKGLLLACSLWFFISACSQAPIITYRDDYSNQKRAKRGIYHKVRKGQTVWRIAKAYNISIDEIISSNRIPNVAKLEENQLIFIAGADTVRDIDVAVFDDDQGFAWPIKGKIVGFYKQGKGAGVNKGINIKSYEGEIVRSARGGKVVFADYLSGYGKTVVLEHAGKFHTIYAQNAQILVSLGEHVSQNTPIAKVGKNRDLALLHFQIRKNSVEQNPLYYLP